MPRFVLATLASLCLAAAGTGCTGDAVSTPAARPAASAAPSTTEPASWPDPFPGRDDVPVGELFAVLAAQADALAAAPDVRRDYAALLAAHPLAGKDALYRDYVRIRLAFEATRAGGLWGARWQVTDQQPQSDRIWTQWQALDVAGATGLPATTAVAECDELSALFAVVARGLGLSPRSEVGLFWPAANHTVAVWMIDRRAGREVRIVVPTSQVFLGPSESLATAGFDPWSQRSIFDYRRVDVSSDATLPAPLAREFVRAVQAHAGQPQRVLQAMRNAREQRQHQAAR